MKSKVVTVTPEIADLFLKNNPKNRKPSQSRVNKYVADMRSGRWAINGESIIFGTDGELLDGQHRLLALIQCGLTIDMVVVTDVEGNAFVTIDSGAGRSLGDVLSIEGYKNTVILSATARASYAYIAGVSVSYLATKASLEDFVGDHPYLYEIANLIGNTRWTVPPAPVAAVMFLANDGDQRREKVGAFLDGVRRGEGLYKGDPRLTLREWAGAQRVRGRGIISKDAMFAATTRAWNAFCEERDLLVIKKLDAPTQATLEIIGFDRIRYPDVPDLVAKRVESGKSLAARRHGVVAETPAT